MSRKKPIAKTNQVWLETCWNAQRAINKVADDKSVSQEESIEALQGLIADAQCCIDGLRDDIKNRD